MLEIVCVKGWRTRLEEARDRARANIWSTASSSIDYVDDFKIHRVYMGFCPVALQEVRRLANRARRVIRSELPQPELDELRAKHRLWHAAWRSNPSNYAKHLESAAAWQRENRDKANAKAARYREQRREQLAIYNQLLRLSKRP
jgi:hypothetical protein